MKPSKIKTVKAKINKLLCPPGFAGCTLFGTVYVRTKKAADKVNNSDEIDSSFKNHEFIHIKQAVTTHNSWLRFYFLYIFMYLYNLPLAFVNIKAPYKFIPFELEAFGKEKEYDYTVKNDADKWKLYRKLSLKKRRKLANEFYSKENEMTFTMFINSKINPLLSQIITKMAGH